MSITPLNTYAGAPNTERGHPTVVSVGPSSLGSRIAYGCGSNVIIRDLQNPLFFDTYTNHQHKVLVAKYSPNGFYMCSGDESGQVKVWATNNADKTTKLEIQPLSRNIRDAAWTNDNQRIIVVGEGKGVYGYVFSYDSGSSVGDISGHSKELMSCDVRQERPFKIITGGEDSQVNFYAGPPFKFQFSNKDHERYVNCVRFSPNGAYFVSASSDKTIAYFDGKTGEKQGVFNTENGHTGSIYQVCWSPDSSKVISASGDKTVKVWDFATKSVINTITFGNDVKDQQVAVFYAGTQLTSVSLTGDFNLLDINAKTPTKTLSGHNEKIYAVTYDPKRNLMFTTGSQGAVLSWDFGVGPKNRLTGKKGHTSAVCNVAISGDYLVTASVDNQLRFTSLDSVQYDNEDSITLVGSPCDITTSPDGLVLVATHKGITVLKDRAIAGEIELGFQPSCVALSPDGKELTVGSDKKIRQYEFTGVAVGALLATFEDHRGKVTKVKYSKDGSLLASSDSNREIFVWDTKARSIKYRDLIYHNAQVTDMDWSKDGKYLVSGSIDKEVIVWDLEKEKRAMTNMAHLQGVTGVVFINENTVASIGNDFALKTWTFKF